ncbi:alpha/beta hydrolase [Nocardiopsis composta]
MEPKRRTLDLPWGTVSYLEWDGRSRGKTLDVLLLHGGGLDSARLSWGALGDALSEAGHRVIAPDHPGYGRSRPPPWPAAQDRLVSYVGEFADGLGLRDYAIGGLSLGGGMTIGHLLARPGEARGAILFGSYGLMDRQFEGALAAPAHLASWVMLRTGMLGAVMRAYAGNRKLMESSLRNIIRDPAQRTPELVDAIMAEAERGSGLASFEQWQRDQILWNRLKTNYTGRLDSIGCPVLIVHGDRDNGVPVAHARAAARRIPDARLLVVPDAGHWVQRDRPEEVTSAVIEFLRELG